MSNSASSNGSSMSGEQASAVRAVSRVMIFWPLSVRVPLLGFALGVCLSQSLFVGIWSIIFVALVNANPGLGLLALLSSAFAYFVVENAWLACLLACLGFAPYIESTAYRIYARGQADVVLSDFLSKDSPYKIREIAIPAFLQNAFPGYRDKERIRSFMEDWARRIRLANTPHEIAPFVSKPVRVFRFSDLSGRAVSAAVAFPVNRYSSLVFVRQNLDSLNDAQRFQLYHELAHGTPEGADIMMRKIRWQVSKAIAFISIFVLLAVCSLVAFQGKSGTITLVFLAIYVWVVFAARKHVEKISGGASEVMADSIALNHPYFSANGRWKERAKSLAKRLEGELEVMNSSDDRYISVYFRMAWLKRWLDNGVVAPYHSIDVDPRVFLGAILLVIAGYFSNIPEMIAAMLFFVALAGAITGCMLLASNGMRSHAAAMEVHQAIEQHLSQKSIE